MAWSTTTWALAGLFPVLTVAGLLLAWRRGAKFALATLGFSLFAAAIHAAATRLTVLPAEWSALAVGAAACAVLRFRTWLAGVVAGIGLVALGLTLVASWRESERVKMVSGGMCPLAAPQVWLFTHVPASLQWQSIDSVTAASDGGSSVPAPTLIGGVPVALIGTRPEPTPASPPSHAESGAALSAGTLETLKRTHELVAGEFVEATGFGWRRMTPMMRWPDIELPLACGRANADEPAGGGPTDGVLNTAAAGGNGGASDAAGQSTGSTVRWVADRVQLVGLLKSLTPRVYDLQGPPTMKGLDRVATRPLDRFESSALERLRNGEDLVALAGPDEIRMLGSLRASRRCFACHDVKIDALLGAFTYRMLPAEKTPPALATEAAVP